MNGKPPFPYYYDRDFNEIRVDEQKRPVYELIKNLFSEGTSCKRIAWELNRRAIPSPGGSHWNDNAVYRVLASEVHLGKTPSTSTTQSETILTLALVP